ncbi:UNVERIFIED_CONTAM: hypothetical protein FKN15_043007 [Acipenser sinensis]
MKCLREKGQGPRIDQYFLRSQSSQSNEIQRQEANHSSQDISTPVIDVRRTCMDTVSDEPNDPCEPGQTNQHKREKNLNGHKPGVKWPRACEKTAWNTVNTDLCFALERLSGTVEKKLDKFGDIIYAYGSERFGVEKRKEKVQTIPGKSRRQQEIERLVRERRQLRKQWRRAEQSQKEGLNLLQRVIKDKLATLRRAERLRKRYKKHHHRLFVFLSWSGATHSGRHRDKADIVVHAAIVEEESPPTHDASSVNAHENPGKPAFYETAEQPSGSLYSLDSNHSHFILVDEDERHKDGTTEMRIKLLKHISEQRTGYGGPPCSQSRATASEDNAALGSYRQARRHTASLQELQSLTSQLPVATLRQALFLLTWELTAANEGYSRSAPVSYSKKVISETLCFDDKV